MLNFLLLLAFAVASTNAFFRMPCQNILTTERLDPIVSPGKVASHVHTVSGGSNFGPDATFDTLRNSTCTSCAVQQDLSAYWTPLLYMQLANGSFVDVQTGGGNLLVYYLQRTGSANEKLVAFPPGFRMYAAFFSRMSDYFLHVKAFRLSGDPFSRSYDPTSLAQQAIDFVCLTYSTNQTAYYGPYLPAQACPDGLRAQVVFPSCWNGQDLYKSDQSHMAFPSGVSTGDCPSTHPVRFITLFYEVTYNVAQMPYNLALNQTQPFVFAMGDTTGRGFHGDFQNGWDVDILQQAIDQCTDDSGVIEKCSVLKLQPQGAQCHKTPTVNEIVKGQMLPQLPGCNPVSPGPERASPCADPNPPSLFTSNVVGYKGAVAPIGSSALANQPQVVLYSNGFNYSGCQPETEGRALATSLTNKISGLMTVDACTSACQDAGFRYCGLEYSQECWGSSRVSGGIQSVDIGNCAKTCSGSPTSYCGGSSYLSLYVNTNTSNLLQTNPGPQGSPFVGCYSEPSGSRLLNGSSLRGSDMTVDKCLAFCRNAGYAYAGLEYSSECYCGNNLPPSRIAQPSADPVLAGCSMTCSGNKLNYCGGPSLLDVYSLAGAPVSSDAGFFVSSTISNNAPSSSSALNPSVSGPTPISSSSSPSSAPSIITNSNGYTYTSCWTDSPARALLKKLIINGPLTIPNCLAACRAGGYSLCGAEYGTECWAGYTALSGSATGKCNTACKGDSSSICGGANALTLYTATDLTGLTKTVASSGSFKFQGCYQEAKSGRALAGAFTSGPFVTIDYCASFCSKKGYAYAATEYGTECFCAATLTAKVASGKDPISAGCNKPCVGNQTQFCGGSSRLSVYHVTGRTKKLTRSTPGANRT